MRVVLKNIHTVKSRGGLYRYHRITGARLPDDTSSPEFHKAWLEQEEIATGKRTLRQTINDLIDAFKDGNEWAALRASTRTIATLNLKAVSNEFGTMPINLLQDRRARPRFLSWHADLARAHPRAADAKLGALQTVLSWSYDRGLIPDYPLKSFSKAYSSARAELIWGPGQIERLLAEASPALRRLIIAARDTGQRRGDLFALTWTAFDGRTLSLIQSKTRRRVAIPCTAELLEAISQCDRSSPYIFTNESGKPWLPDNFKKPWRAACNKAGISGLNFHDLRGTAVTRLSEAGCTVPEIVTITGHSLQSAGRILEVYLARTPTMARAAITKLEHHRKSLKAAN